METRSAWRKVLKDLITYFHDIQKTYEARSKSLYTLSNVIGNINIPPMFLAQGGIGDATHILQAYHKKAITEGNKAKTIEDEVVAQLTGLRSDLQQKVKEIKSLSGDFKNNVEKESEATRRAVHELHVALGLANTDPSATSGKGDPFIVKTAVDRQLLRQIDEENYLHRVSLAFLLSKLKLTSTGIFEPRKLRSRIRVHRGGRDPESLQRLCGSSQKGSGRSIRCDREASIWSTRNS